MAVVVEVGHREQILPLMDETDVKCIVCIRILLVETRCTVKYNHDPGPFVVVQSVVDITKIRRAETAQLITKGLIDRRFQEMGLPCSGAYRAGPI
jgi:hypothetical protein